MKRILFILGLCQMTCYGVMSQTIKHPFVEEGKVWNMFYESNEFVDPVPDYEFKYFIEGDTLIAGQNCKKFYSFNENNNNKTEYKMALHESEGKVYFIPDGSTKSYILYDFTIPVGTSTVISSVSSPESNIEMRNNRNGITKTNGISRHCLLVSWVADTLPPGWWIEGIGSELGPLDNFQFGSTGAYILFLNCEVNGEYVFNMTDFRKDIEKGECYPEGTRWTEIRLDTLKHDSWYSKVGDEWVPNFETIEYRVQGEYVDERYNDRYSCIYTNGPEWADSLTLLIYGGRNQDGDWYGGIAVAAFDDDGQLSWPCLGQMYSLSWEMGTIMRSLSIDIAGITGFGDWMWDEYGTIEEIKERDFGGVRPLTYSDVNGIRFIREIGVASWNDGECLFGPIRPYEVLSHLGAVESEERHYRSMLVHFERDGEVLYDLWPEKIGTGISATLNDKGKMINDNSIYDLSGRKISAEANSSFFTLHSSLKRGIYIEGGKKKVK